LQNSKRFFTSEGRHPRRAFDRTAEQVPLRKSRPQLLDP
jgi:hypothetical protein